MKKPRKRRTRASGKQSSKSTSPSLSLTLASPTPKQIEPTQQNQTRSVKSRFGFPIIIRFGKKFWACVGLILALTSAWFLLSPKISIGPSVNLDPSQPLATQFLISNNGNVPVYNVYFGCGLGGGGAHSHIGTFQLSASAIAPVPKLPAGASVTRSCALESEDIQVPDITITATYTWPVIEWQSSQTAHFSLRHGTSGFFLVPDFR
jgi:hypothetical protein